MIGIVGFNINNIIKRRKNGTDGVRIFRRVLIVGLSRYEKPSRRKQVYNQNNGYNGSQPFYHKNHPPRKLKIILFSQFEV